MPVLLVSLVLTLGADAGTPLEPLAAQLAQQLVAAKPEPPLALAVEGHDAALARGLASLVAAHLARAQLSPVVLDAPLANAETLARARDLRSLARVHLVATGGALVAQGDLVSTWVNFWSGRAPARTGNATTLLARSEAGAVTPVAEPTARAPLALVATTVAALPHPPAAVALGDLDGDGQPELVALAGDVVFRFRGTGEPLGRTALPESLAPRPSREPFGALVVQNGRLRVLSAKRALGAELDAKGTVLGTLESLTLDGLTLKLVPGLAAFAPALGKLTLNEPAVAVSTRLGATLAVGPSGAGALTRTGWPTQRFTGAGAASCLADVDGDGAPELVTTSPLVWPKDDEVRVLDETVALATQEKSGALGDAVVRAKAPLPPGRAIVAASGDLDHDGADEVLLGVWNADGTGALVLVRGAR